MINRLLIAFILLAPVITYSQELKPPLGLEFGMSKVLFFGRMLSRYKPPMTGKGYTESDTLVVFSNIRFGSGISEELSASFFKNQLYQVKVRVTSAQKDEMYDTYTEKYGASDEKFGPAWRTKKHVIYIMNYGSYSEFTYLDRLLEFASRQRERTQKEKQHKDY